MQHFNYCNGKISKCSHVQEYSSKNEFASTRGKVHSRLLTRYAQLVGKKLQTFRKIVQAARTLGVF